MLLVVVLNLKLVEKVKDFSSVRVCACIDNQYSSSKDIYILRPEFLVLYLRGRKPYAPERFFDFFICSGSGSKQVNVVEVEAASGEDADDE